MKNSGINSSSPAALPFCIDLTAVMYSSSDISELNICSTMSSIDSLGMISNLSFNLAL